MSDVFLSNRKTKTKFKHWYTKKTPTHKIDAKKVAINLTNRELEPAAVSVLSKGLDFAQTTDSRANLKETISGTERAIYTSQKTLLKKYDRKPAAF